MSSKKKQNRMVLQHGRATSSAAGHSPAGSQTQPWKAREGGLDRGLQVTGQDSDSRGTMSPSKEAISRSGSRLKHLVSPSFQGENLSADSVCSSIKVTLDNNVMWNEFYRCKTEMILTKQGSRMFPYCRFRISGLKPSQRYSLVMDIQPLDSNRYRWTGKNWQAAGKADVHIKSEPFAHPESPASGQHWMQNPVSFFRLKLTNNLSDQEGNTILNPMHRYLPRLHVIPTDKAVKDLNSPGVVTFTFPQTEFMAVTAYQNTQFAQLKVDCNPFSKGLKEDSSRPLGLKQRVNSIKDSNKDGLTSDNEQHPIKKSLKSLLANHKPKSSKSLESKVSSPQDLQTQTHANRDQSASRVPGKCSGSVSHPSQKLFSELIRDAHVSLHRCDVDQLNHSALVQVERSRTKTTSLKGKGPSVVRKESTSSRTFTKKDKSIAPTKKTSGEGLPVNVLDCKDSNRTNHPGTSAPTCARISSKDLDYKDNVDISSEATVRQHKRPPRLPLPALALFLKQHSNKSKKSKPVPSHATFSSENEGSSTCLSSDLTNAAIGLSNDIRDEASDSDLLVSRESYEGVHSDQRGLNTTPTDITDPGSDSLSPTASRSVQSKTDNSLVSISDRLSPEPTVPESTVLPGSNPPSCTQRCVTETSPTSSVYPTSPLPFSSALPVPNSIQGPTQSSPLRSDSDSLKPDSLLPDPGCSSFSFETLSPGSSPEHLPSLSDSLAFQLDSTASETDETVGPAQNPGQEGVSSVFQWHTVLPPPQAYIDPSFTEFQPEQTVPLMSTSPPLLPSPASLHSEPENLGTTVLPPGPPPSFHETEQSLPFPTELSPLALNLSLSPSFSPLDGEALSPTPSLSDLVQFFSIEDELTMEFSNTEVAATPGPSLPVVVTQNPPHDLESASVSKTCKRKKSSHRRKLAKMHSELVVDEAAYQSMQPNLEEVEEQLFVSFTSKEALKRHIVDSSVEPVPEPQPAPEDEQTAEIPENAISSAESPSEPMVQLPSAMSSAESPSEPMVQLPSVMSSAESPHEPMVQLPSAISSTESPSEPMVQLQEDLLRDLKLMKHRQVIHPVLQEVGLKMNLLDPMLAIDLQYLGVRLPLPPPGAPLELASRELPPSEAAFVSRTGKTTDVTQIKGWREKFTSSEAPPADCTPEVGPSSEPQKKKNLSAFCSDMLDEYLENEGRLIDERAASFSQLPTELPVYQLPTQSSSYVRTLDSILKKQDTANPAADLISGFIPPSKRPRLPEARVVRKKPKILKSKPRSESGPDGTAAGTAGFETGEVKLAAQTTASSATESTITKRRRRFNPRTTTPPPGMEDLAPLESDSELGPDYGQIKDSIRGTGRPEMTRAMLKQKDLEDAVTWEGRPRNGITEERANVALTSLFTLTGFVREDPLAPVQLKQRRPARCLNDFCRLGCVCSSLFNSRRVQHCGRPACMFGCSCLKQKVVLLKNLDGSLASHPSGKKRKRRMKMAYILKEADSVSHPAERINTLWRHNSEDPDPEPVYIPPGSVQPISKPTPAPAPTVQSTSPKAPKAPKSTSTAMRRSRSSCARVRVYKGKSSLKGETKDTTPQPECMKNNQLTEESQPPKKPLRAKKNLQPKKTPLPKKTRQPKGSLQPTETPTIPPCESPNDDTPKPSKRLFILADCQWGNGDRSYVLKRLCEAMAQDQLDQPFWIKSYLIQPAAPTVEGGTDPCIHYRVHISKPMEDKPPQTSADTTGGPRVQRKNCRWPEALEQDNLKKESQSSPELDDGTVEDWQRAVEDADLEVEQKVDVDKKDVPDLAERSWGMMGDLALPFLTGISPAGFLSARRKEPGGSNQLVQVNGKLYPLAKIQLGMMGALHPANRLAAYLTGRVGPGRCVQAPSSLSSTPSSLTNPHHKLEHTAPASPLPLHPHAPAPKSPQLQKIQVQAPPPPPASQRLLVESVPVNSATKYYRRPDGKLIEVLVTNMTPLTSKTTVQTGPVASQDLPAMLGKINSGATPLKHLRASLSSSSTPQASPGPPGGSKKTTPAVTHHKPPSQPPSAAAPPIPPRPPVSHQGAEPKGAAVMSRQQKLTETHPPSGPPPVAPALPFEPGQVDNELVIVGTQEAEVELAQSSESDMTSDSDSEEEQQQQGKENHRQEKQQQENPDGEEFQRQRVFHNWAERERRHEMRRLFDRLRRQAGQTSQRLSKICTLQKAVGVIQELRQVENELMQEKNTLIWKNKRLLESYLETADPIEISVDMEQRIETQHVSQRRDVEPRLPTIMTKHGLMEMFSWEKQQTANQQSASSNAKTLSHPPLARLAPRIPSSCIPTVGPRQSTPLQDDKPVMQRKRQRLIPNILSRSKRPANPAPSTSSAPSGPPGPPAPSVSSVSSASSTSSAPSGPPGPPAPSVSSVSSAPSTSSAPLLPPASSAPCPTTKGGLPSYIIPTDVLSLLQTTLPGQPVPALRPQVPAPVVLQSTPPTGGSSFVPNLPDLTNHQLCLTALPHPQTATNIINLVPQQQPPPAPLPLPPPPPATLVEVCKWMPAVGRPPTQKPAARLAVTRPPGVSAVPVSVPQGIPEGPDGESLTSLLNELVFLNQQTVTMTTPATTLQADHGYAVGGTYQQACSTNVPQLASSGPVAIQMQVGLNKHADIELANWNTKAAVQAPPPLLQMKVGGTKLSEPSSCDDGRGRGEAGMTWRPMPRLVPLGLRGNPAP